MLQLFCIRAQKASLQSYSRQRKWNVQKWYICKQTIIEVWCFSIAAQSLKLLERYIGGSWKVNWRVKLSDGLCDAEASIVLPSTLSTTPPINVIGLAGPSERSVRVCTFDMAMTEMDWWVLWHLTKDTSKWDLVKEAKVRDWTKLHERTVVIKKIKGAQNNGNFQKKLIGIEAAIWERTKSTKWKSRNKKSLNCKRNSLFDSQQRDP